ncbi:hypothetical protein UFOVP630_15 [uncultured Caudovirales phage]|uniref:Uncharacterized protein n=1 Tax=uncultured Caudovirales phage TaxID=2100421 RepID=A0A6J5N3L7_9CAUD|nr:hypothetical protein UFOVP630_15 [uncultured Caudovirales phage]
MKRYLITLLSAFVIEIASTFYITAVSGRDYLLMIIFAGIGPFLGLPFINYIIESNDIKDKIKISVAMSIGYMIGSLFVIYFIK